jgi:uncharacterized RDD family membrane protein YckC
MAFFVAVIAFSSISIVGLGSGSSLDLSAPISWLTAITVFLTYFAASYRLWGKTPAMMLGKLSVIDANTSARLSWGRSYLRSLVLSVQILTGILTIIWLVVAASSQSKQGPHDRAGRSLVVRAS